MASRLSPAWLPPVALRQSGLFTPGQAIDAGATPAQVRRRRDTGRWRTIAGDAVALSTLEPTPWLRIQAAGLTWPDAVVCFTSAAALHGLPVPDDRALHVIVPNRRASRSGLVSHELRIGTGDIVRSGLALVTSRRRTLFDCIGRLPPDHAERLVAWAFTRDLLNRDDLARLVADRPRWWGNTQRRQALHDTSGGALSAAERRLHAILRGARITGWRADQKIWHDGRLIARVDALFPAERLVLEVDGHAAHSGRQFQDDRTRQNRLVAAGFTVLRFTWADLTERPGRVTDEIRRTLAMLARPR